MAGAILCGNIWIRSINKPSLKKNPNMSLGSVDCAQDGRKEGRIFGLIKSVGVGIIGLK